MSKSFSPLTLFIIATILVPCFLSHAPRLSPPTTSSESSPISDDTSIDFGLSQLNNLNGDRKPQAGLELSDSLTIPEAFEEDEDLLWGRVLADTVDDSTVTIVQLTEAVFKKGTLSSDGSAFFTFNVTNPQPRMPNLGIDLVNSSKQKLIICVRNDGQMPQKTSCQWKGTGSSLAMLSSDAEFDPTSNYTIGVFAEETPDASTKVSFSIVWYQAPTFASLDFSSPYSGSTSQIQAQYLQVDFNTIDNPRMIIQPSTDSLHGSVEVYVYNLKSQAVTSTSKYSATASLNIMNCLDMDDSSLQKLCKISTSVSSSGVCSLFLVVKPSKNTDKADFDLLIDSQFASLVVDEGVQNIVQPMTKDIVPIHLQFNPSEAEDAFVIVSLSSIKLGVYVNVIDNRKFDSEEDWTWPTTEKFKYSSDEGYQVTLRVPATSYKSCASKDDLSHCVLLATIVPTATPLIGTPTTISMLVTQDAAQISVEQTIDGTLAPNQYKYFMFDVTSIQTNIIISLASTSTAQIDFGVSKGANSRPTLMTQDFKAKSYGGMNYLQISAGDTSDDSMQGTWVIGVSSQNSQEESLDFTLSVFYEDHKFIRIDNQLSNELIIGKDQTTYFNYYLDVTDDISFKFVQMSGKGEYYITILNNTHTVTENLPGVKNNYWTGSISDTRTVVTISQSDEHYCSLCTYLIAVTADEDLHLMLTPTFPFEASMLRPDLTFRDYVDTDIVNYYTKALTTYQYDLNILVDSGEPTIYIGIASIVNETNFIWKCQPTQGNYISYRLNNVNQGFPYVISILGCNNDKIVTLEYPDLFFSIVSDTPCDYSLGLSAFNASTNTPPNVEMDGFLNSDEADTYYITSPNQNTTNSVKIVAYRDKFTNSLDDAYRAPNIVLTPISDASSSAAKPLQPFRSFVMQPTPSGSLLYTAILQYPELPESSYSFKIQNNYTNSRLNYSLIVNPLAPIELPVNIFYLSRAAVGSTDMYLVNIDQPGVLLIEVHACIGEVLVSYSSSYTGSKPSGPIDGQTSDTSTSYISFMSDELEYGQVVYINVTSVDGVVDDDYITSKEAVYKIKTTFYNKDNQGYLIPYDSLSSESKGNITWKLYGDSNLKLGFGDIAQNGSTPSSANTDLNFTSVYDVFVTKEQVIGEYLARCDVVPDAKGIFKDLDGEYSQLNFEPEDVSTDGVDAINRFIETGVPLTTDPVYISLRITLMGLDSQGEVMWRYPVTYQTVKAIGTNPPPAKPGSSSHVWIIILLLLLVVVIGGLCWYRKKLRDRKMLFDSEHDDQINLRHSYQGL